MVIKNTDTGATSWISILALVLVARCYWASYLISSASVSSHVKWGRLFHVLLGRMVNGQDELGVVAQHPQISVA